MKPFDKNIFYSKPLTLIVFGVLLFLMLPSTPAQTIDSLILESSQNPNSGIQETHTITSLITLAGEYTLSQPTQALVYYNEALDLIKKLQIETEEAGVYNFMGKVYEQQGIYNLAMEYYFKSLSLYENIDDTNAVTWSYSDIGNIYYVQTSYGSALEYYHRALSIFKKDADEYGIATTLNNVALVYEALNKQDSALILFNEALEIRKKIGNKNLIAHSYTYIGRIYDFWDNNGKALEFYRLSHELYQQSGNQDGKASTMRYIGNVYWQSGNYQKSTDSYQKSLELCNASENNFSLALTYGELARVQAEAGDFELAIANARQMQSIAIAHGILLHQSAACKLLSDIYEKKGDNEAAFKYYKTHVLLKDSIDNKEIAETISRQEFVYQREKGIQELRLKENEIALLERNERIEKIKRNTLLIGLILIGIIGILVYSRQYNIHKKDRELIHKKEEIQKAQLAIVEVQKKEKESLKNELEAKQTELTNFALHIVQKNELMRDIKLKLHQLHKCNEEEGRGKLNEMIISLSENKTLGLEMKQFQKKIDKQHAEFFKKLKERYPDLTQNEKRLIALLRLHLTTKEIASLNNISEKAVEMGRYRLRKKLNMGVQSNLHDFLRQL